MLNLRFMWVITVACLALNVRAADFFTTNRESLVHFWAAAESSNRPVTVLSFGDSMADSYRSATFHLVNKLRARIGTAGYSLNNYGNTLLARITNGAFVIQGGEHWFSYYFGVPAGAALWWDNEPNPGGVFCDSAGIFFVSQTNGGQFRLSISTNGEPWATKLILDGFSATPTGHFTNLLLQPNRYRLRVDSDFGTNYILGASTLMTQASGVHVVFLDQPGIPLFSVTNIPIEIRSPVVAALKPDLIVWHMKEPIAPLLSGMEECERWWSNAAPDCDVIYIGTTWNSGDNPGTDTIDQNTIVRGVAVKYHRAYADLMLPTINYQWLLTNGFAVDEVHLNSAGGLFCANLMWDDLGFFALGLNRKLSLAAAGSQLQLNYNTDSRARYRLETSTNLQSWVTVLTNSLESVAFSTNFIPPADHAYFRLKLTPN